MNKRFNGGQCIVITKLNSSYVSENRTDIKVNYVYKQRKTFRYLLPELNALDDKLSGYSFITPDNTHGNEYRIATPIESARYKQLKKPYDINDNDYLIEDMFKNLDILEDKYNV